MSRLDLDDLVQWSDEDLTEALAEIEDGLTDKQMMWIERYSEALEEWGHLTDRQREVAESILSEWNEKQ